MWGCGRDYEVNLGVIFLEVCFVVFVLSYLLVICFYVVFYVGSLTSMVIYKYFFLISRTKTDFKPLSLILDQLQILFSFLLSSLIISSIVGFM